MRPSIRIVVIALAAALALAGQAFLSKPRLQAQSSDTSSVPNLADLMATMQLRHLKLAWAGDLKNWELSSYEVGQMRESFAAAAKHYPVFQNIQLAKLIADISEPALKEIDDSIKEKDHTGVTRGFKNLTDACNSCHKTAGFGFIAIRVPTSMPFSNQTFVPRQP